MSDRAYRRFTRYAAFSAAHLVVAGGLVLTPEAGPYGGLALLVISLPLLWAWGLYQADVALNPALDESRRWRWRVVLWCLPWTMALYWHRHVRPRRYVD